MIKRAELLACLQKAAIGLSSKELLEQSNAFVFEGEHLITFNGEVMVKTKNLLGFDAIIQAEDLMKLLSKFPDDEIEITKKESEIVLKGLRRSAGVTCAAEIHLPYDTVPAPTKWTVLEKSVPGILQQAARTCGQDETQILTTCIHITPEKIEACDNYRLFVYTGKTGLSEEILLPASSVSLLNNLSIAKVSIDKEWAHFQLSDGTQVTIRCFHMDYHKGRDLLKILDVTDGEKIELPKNLSEMIERAEVMNAGGYENEVVIQLTEGELEITSQKEGGWYKEKKRVKYAGREMLFHVNPLFLTEVLEKTHTVTCNAKRMKITLDNIIFLVGLKQPEKGE